MEKDLFNVTNDSNRIEEYPFSISFTWKYKTINIRLDNGQDVIKIGEIFAKFLEKNGIPNKVTIIQNK